MSLHTRRRSLPIALLIGIAATLLPLRTACAQVTSLRRISAEGAQAALAAAVEEARKNGWAVSIAVVDPAGELVAFLRTDGAPYSSIDISRAKARTAARFRRPTRALDSALVAGRTPILSLDGATAVEGGVPVTLNGEVVGAVGVSGGTSAQDAQVAQAGAAAVKP